MKTVLITGTTSGFGIHMVEGFLQAGFKVIATGRNLLERRHIFSTLHTQHPHRLIELNLDITLVSERQQVAHAVSQLGGLDVLVNNAGYGLFGPFEDTSEAQIRQQMEVNFFGTVLLTQSLLPELRKKQGKIFALSSMLGFTALPFAGAYCASKFALEGWAETLSYELNSYGVQVCVIEPGGYRTQFSQNIDWSRATTETVYSRAYSTFKKTLQVRSARPKFSDPTEVATGIVKLAQKSRIPMRMQFGTDSKMTKLLRRMTPESLYFKLTQRVYTRMLQETSL